MPRDRDAHPQRATFRWTAGEMTVVFGRRPGLVPARPRGGGIALLPGGSARDLPGPDHRVQFVDRPGFGLMVIAVAQ